MLARKLACWVAATAVPFSQVDGLIKGRFPVYFAGALRGQSLPPLPRNFALLAHQVVPGPQSVSRRSAGPE